MRLLVSDMAGRASIELKGRELGFDLSATATWSPRVTARVKELEARGYTFEAADASFELLLAEEVEGARPSYFDVESWRVITETRPGDEAVSEATVKLRAEGVRYVVTGEGNGPVNALDHALRQAIGQAFPEVAKFELIDYKVRILDQGHGTDAITRVLIETSDGASSWVTVGVGHNVIEASWGALARRPHLRAAHGTTRADGTGLPWPGERAARPDRARAGRRRTPRRGVAARAGRPLPRPDRRRGGVRDPHARARPDAPTALRQRPDDAGPLFGVPTAIKDLNLTAGVRTTFGSPVVRRLRARGLRRRHAGDRGRRAWSASARPPRPSSGRPATPSPRVLPPAVTPWDRTRMAGGSSGGAAAAVAAGPGARRPGLRRRWLDPDPRVVLRARRAQADAWPDHRVRRCTATRWVWRRPGRSRADRARRGGDARRARRSWGG